MSPPPPSLSACCLHADLFTAGIPVGIYPPFPVTLCLHQFQLRFIKKRVKTTCHIVIVLKSVSSFLPFLFILSVFLFLSSCLWLTHSHLCAGLECCAFDPLAWRQHIHKHKRKKKHTLIKTLPCTSVITLALIKAVLFTQICCHIHASATFDPNDALRIIYGLRLS